MTKNQLCSTIAKLEGKKHQASIGDVREIVNLLIELQATAPVMAEAPCSVIMIEAAKLELKMLKKKKPKK